MGQKLKNGYNYPNPGVFKTILWVIFPIITFFAFQLLATIFVLFLNASELMSSVDAYKKITNDNIMLIALITQILNIAVLLPIFLKQRCYLPEVKESAGIKVIITGIVFALGASFAVSLLMEPLNSIMQNIIPDGGYNTVNDTLTSSGTLFIQFVYIVIIGPIAEEIMFRGFIFNRLMSKMPAWGAVVVSGALFGIFHMNSVQSILAFFIGVAIAILYIKTRSIIACMVFHIINNGFSFAESQLVASAGGNADTINTIFMWISIAVIVLAVVASVIFFRSKGAVIKTQE